MREREREGERDVIIIIIITSLGLPRYPWTSLTIILYRLSLPVGLLGYILHGVTWYAIERERERRHHHHHHHVARPAQISLNLSHHHSLSSIASGRSSRLHPTWCDVVCYRERERRHHHHHHVARPAQISLNLSHHHSLSSIASGRSSRLHPTWCDVVCYRERESEGWVSIPLPPLYLNQQALRKIE